VNRQPQTNSGYDTEHHIDKLFVLPPFNNCLTLPSKSLTITYLYPTLHLIPGRTKCVIRTVPKVSLAGGPGLKISQSRTVGSDKWRPSVLTSLTRACEPLLGWTVPCFASREYKSMKLNNKNLKIPQDLPAASVARQFEDRSLDRERPIVVDNPPQSNAAGRSAPRAPQGPTRGRLQTRPYPRQSSAPASLHGSTAGPSRPMRPMLTADRRQGQHRQRKKDALLPPRGQPGGLDDPNRRNLCGSSGT